ncbi:MAG: hypothetical protein R3E51_12525 [Rhizobiaceae bacterium]
MPETAMHQDHLRRDGNTKSGLPRVRSVKAEAIAHRIINLRAASSGRGSLTDRAHILKLRVRDRRELALVATGGMIFKLL